MLFFDEKSNFRNVINYLNDLNRNNYIKLNVLLLVNEFNINNINQITK